jgi:DNA polymerase elongation subunit (family B)
MDVFYKKSREEVIEMILDYLKVVFTGGKALGDFVITKSVKSTSEYKSRELPTDPIKREKRLKDLGCKSEEDYFLKSLPANIQLAEKMRRRGKIVANGQRIEYVITDPSNPLGNLFDKVEDPEHLMEFPDIVRLDYLYYIKLMTVPLDECLEVGFGIKEFMTRQYKLHLKKWKVNREIEELFRPKVRVISVI